MKLLRSFVPVLVVATSVGASAQFYTVDENSDFLQTIDVTTGATTPIGPLGVGYDFGDLAYDSSTGTMYMVDGWGGGFASICTLYTVNLTTGAATAVGSCGVPNLFGLAYHPTNGKLYASTSTLSPTAFYEINKSTGAATYIGDPLNSLDGLTYVGSTGQIVGLWAGPGSLHEIAISNANNTLASPGGGFVNNCGIAWSAANNTIYSVDWSGELYAFDVANGYARTTVASGLGAMDGLAAVGAGGCVAPTNYCTGGTTTNGCVASITASGTPSVAATSGFNLSVTSVEGQRSGLIFYGTSGQLATPWALGSSSFLCVKPPTQRTPTQNSGGTTNSCTGAFNLDWLAYMTANPGALGHPLTTGQVFNAQGWFRDPPAVKTTNLSNGVQWTMCP